MGVLDRFERRVESVVNGVFAKAFKSEVQPVELASALRREVDTTSAVVGPGRTLVPNAFTIDLGPTDRATGLDAEAGSAPRTVETTP